MLMSSFIIQAIIQSDVYCSIAERRFLFRNKYIRFILMSAIWGGCHVYIQDIWRNNMVAV